METPYHQDNKYCKQVSLGFLRRNLRAKNPARRVLGDYSPYSSVSDMLGKLSWRILEQRHADSRLVLFYKIAHGYVAVPLPSYVITLTRISRTSHPLAYRQIYTRTDYYKYSFFFGSCSVECSPGLYCHLDKP